MRTQVLKTANLNKSQKNKSRSHFSSIAHTADTTPRVLLNVGMENINLNNEKHML